MTSAFISELQNQHQQNKLLIGNEVIQAYEKLHNNIDDMQNKVEHVIQKHESQFMLAYRSHISKIKRQLGQIKKKSEEQQKMFSSNDRIKYLQKQISIFRQEALKIYDKLEKTTKQMQLYKTKYEDTLRMYQLSERTARESIKHSKMLNATQQSFQQTIKKLTEKIQVKDRQIEQLKKYKGITQNQHNLSIYKSIGSQRSSKNRYDKIDGGENTGIESTVKRTIRIGDSFYVQNNNYKDLFFECLKKVKKQIALRKNVSKIDFKNISFSQFREIDKMRVFTLFFSNPELEMLLYEKLFPNNFLKKLDPQKAQVQKNNQFQFTTPGFALPRFKDTHRRFASRLEAKNNSFV